MFCKTCGKEISDEVRFCKYCGAPVVNDSYIGQSQKSEAFIYGNGDNRKSQKRGITAIIVFAVLTIGLIAFAGIFLLKLNDGDTVTEVENQSNSVTEFKPSVSVKTSVESGVESEAEVINTDNITTETISEKDMGITPEETVEIFLNALKEQDFDTMFDCCYIEDYADNFSFEEYVNRVGVMDTNMFNTLPPEYDMYRDLWILERRGEFAEGFRNLSYSLLLDRESEEWEEYWIELYQNRTLTGLESDLACSFVAEVDLSLLQNLKIQSIDIYDSGLYDVEYYSNYYFSSSFEEIRALLDINGNLYCKGFFLTEIDGYWQIAELYAYDEYYRYWAEPVESVSEYEDLLN